MQGGLYVLATLRGSVFVFHLNYLHAKCIVMQSEYEGFHYPQLFLATLVALHFTPVSKRVSER